MLTGALKQWETNSALEESGLVEVAGYVDNGYLQCYCDSRKLEGDEPEQTYGPLEEQICL